MSAKCKLAYQHDESATDYCLQCFLREFDQGGGGGSIKKVQEHTSIKEVQVHISIKEVQEHASTSIKEVQEPASISFYPIDSTVEFLGTATLLCLYECLMVQPQ
jgi:hypothetical protein